MSDKPSYKLGITGLVLRIRGEGKRQPGRMASVLVGAFQVIGKTIIWVGSRLGPALNTIPVENAQVTDW